MADTPVMESVPLTPKGRRTRERIIHAAADLVYDASVASVSLDDVRAVTGTSKSQLYHYFANKNDLMHAVIDCQRERVLGFHRAALASLTSWDDIRRWRDMIVGAQATRGCRGGCPLGSLASEVVELDDTARRQLADAFASWQQLLADGLAVMIEAGALRADAEPEALAVSVIASLQGGLLLAEISRSTEPLEIALDAALMYLKSFA